MPCTVRQHTMDLGLKGKVALVAAASKGLGYGVAHALAAEGAKLAICSRDADSVAQAAQKLHDETGAEVLGTACDVSQRDQINVWVQEAAAHYGHIDSLTINAGGPPAGRLLSFDEDQWQAAFELTLMSAVRMIRAAVPHMKDGGAILAITSSSWREPVEMLGLSTVMRAGVSGLIKTLADELAADEIRLNNLMPGRIDTDRVAALDQNTANRQGISFDEARARSLVKIPLKRLGTIEEFGRAGAFLLSPAAAYITGETLRVDGGMMRSV